MSETRAKMVATLLRDVGNSIVMPRFGTLHQSEIETKSSPTDLVTIADREAEIWLTPRLRELVDCEVVGEEACAATPDLRNSATADRAWTVDPIDGTSNFVKGNERFCSMIALLENGVPQECWIWLPMSEELFYAKAGGGACLKQKDGQTTPLQLAHTSPTGGDIDASKMRGGGNSLGVEEPQRTQIREVLKAMPGRWFPGSCGVLGANIAQGMQHFLLHGDCTPWDHSPVDLLCREAGGHAAMLADGAPFNAGFSAPFMIAASSAGWQELQSRVMRRE